MDKPKFYENGRCPSCHSTDVVWMGSDDDSFVLWCSCGKVFVCEDGETKEVYKFGKES